MERFAESANKAAKELGASTIDYTKASLIYYQQGLADEDVAARTDVTLKAANVTGQTTQEVSEQLTAVWNGYKVSAEEAELYVDKLAAVAATTASDLEELSTGMSKVASAANAMGVDVDQLNGMLSTIVSVTRQAPESAGTALKTIFARMGDLKINGEDEFGVSLGEVSGQLAEVGINIMNAKGELREMGEVIEEVGNKWNTGAWTNAEKQAIAIELAGKRQYNNLLALFDNWDMYNKAVETSMSSQGTLQKQQDIYMESTAAHLQQMQTSWEGVKDAILKPDDVNPLIDVFGTFGKITKEAIEGLGGLKGVLTLLGTVGLQTFGPILGESLAGFISNLDIAKAQASALATELQFTQQLKNGPYQNDEGVRFLVDEMEKLQGIYGNITTEQANMLKKLIETASEATNVKLQYEAIADAAAHAVNDKNKYTDTPTNYTGEELLKNNMWDVVQKASGEFEDASINVKAFSDSLRQSKQVTDDFDDEMQMVSQTIEKFGDKDQSIIDLGVEIQELANKVRTGEKPITDLADKLDILASGAKTTADQLDKVGSEMGEKYANSVVTAANATDTLHDKLELGNIQNLTANITKTVGSIGQLTMGVQMLTSAFDSIQKESFDFSQFLISITMGVPMVIRSFQEMGKVFNITSSLFDVMSAKEKARQALTMQGTTIDRAAWVVKNQENLQTEIQLHKNALLNKIKAENITLTGSESAAELIQIGIKQGVIAADGAEAQALKKLITLQNTYNASVLANPYLLIGAAIIASITAIYTIYKKYNETLEEQRQEQIKLEQEKQKELNTNRELYDSYLQVAQGIKDGTSSIEDMQKAADDLNDIYDSQAIRIAKLTGNYEAMTDAIRQAKEESLEDTISSNREEIDNLIDSKTISSAFDKYVDSFNASNGIVATNVGKDTDFGKFLSTKGYQYADGAFYTKTEGPANGSDMIQEFQNRRQYIEEYEKQLKEIYKNDKKAYQQALEDFHKDTYYTDYKELLGTDDIQAYLDSIQEIGEATLEQGVLQLQAAFDNAPLNQEEISKKVAELVKTYQEETGVLADEAKQAVLRVLQSLGIDAIDKWIEEDTTQEERSIAQSKTINRFRSEYDNAGHLLSGGDYARKQFEEDKGNFDLNKATLDEIQAYESWLEHWSMAERQTYDAFKEDWDYQQGKIINETSLNSVSTLLTLLEKDTKLTKKELKEVAELENQIGGTEIRLAEIRDKNSKEYLKALQEVQKELEQQQIDTAKEEFNYKLDKAFEGKDKELEYKLSLDGKEFTDTMSDILEADYSIDVKIQADLESDFQNSIDEMTSIEKMTQKIGDNFIIAADDIREMNAAFPGILDGIKYLSDGTAQLNQEAVESAIGLADAEAREATRGAVEKMRAEQQYLMAKAKAHEAILAVLKTVQEKEVKGEKRSAEDQANLDNALNQLKALNSEQSSQSVMNNHEQVAESADANAENMAEHWANAASSVAENMHFMASQSINFLDAMSTIPPGDLPPVVTISSLYKGGSKGTAVTATNTFESGNPIDLSSLQVSDELIIQEEEIINALLGQANDIEGMIGELTAKTNEVHRSASNVASGKAGKDKKKSGSSAQPDKKDLLHAEKEIDVYHDINLELDEIEHQMKLLQKAEDKAFGKNYLDNLNAQNKLLEKQKKLLKEKLQLTANDMATRRAQLSEMGVAFDEEGYMTNYNALLTERLNKYNELITAYNAMGAAQQKTSKQSIEDAKKEFDLLKERVSEYDKLFNSFNSLEEELQDKMDEQIENQIKAFNYEVDVRLDMAEATRNWNDFYEKVIEDIEGIEDPVKKIITSMQTGLKNFESYYNGRDGLGSIQYLTEHVRETMAQVESIKNTGTSSVYGDNMSAAVEDLKKYNDSLMENLEDAQDIINKIKDSYLDAIDEANDKLEEQTKQYEYIVDLINHDMNMVELLGGEDDYADLARYYEMMHTNNMQNVEFLRMQRDAIKAQLDAVEEGSEAWKKLYEQVQDAQKDLNSAVEDSLNNIIDKYSNAIKNIFDKLNKSVTSGLGLDYMQESYDRQVDNGDNYLDNPNRLYAIEKIRNKYEDALNSTSDLAAQRKIADVMAQQLKYLEEKDQLSQYEVERAEKIYDLTMKQIALQEAQANKSQLRLKRDAQGNYSYQYVADQDAINDAQQEVNDAMNDLYNFDLENYRDILGQATELTKEYEELVTEILENAALSEEERTQRLAEVKNWYYTEMNALEEQLAINKVNLQESANMELEELYRQNNEIFQGVIFEEMVPGWNGALDEMVTNFTEDFIPRCEESMRDLEAETKQYQDEIDVLAAQAGVDFGLIKTGTDAVIGATQQLMQTNEAVIGTYNQEMSAIMGAVNAMEQLIQKYQEAQQQAIATADAAAKMWNALQLGAYSTTASAAIEGIANSIKDTAKELNSMGDAVSNTAKQVGAVEKEKEKTSNGYSIVVGGELVQHGLTKEEAYRVSAKIPNYGPSVSIMTDEDWWKRVGRFATGGYTGDWHSNDGKLAVLDSKELVLNADDTKNMLDAVNIVRHIVASLDGSMNTRVAGMAINPDFTQALSGVGGASAVDQNVTISASFPNVSSHTEIEQAFENLVNRASQAAWSTRV